MMVRYYIIFVKLSLNLCMLFPCKEEAYRNMLFFSSELNGNQLSEKLRMVLKVELIS